MESPEPGETIAQAARAIGVTEQTLYRWWKEYGGFCVDQAKRMKEIEKENVRLRHAASDLTLDNQILQEVVPGTYKALHVNALRSRMWSTSSVNQRAAPPEKSADNVL